MSFLVRTGRFAGLALAVLPALAQAQPLPPQNRLFDEAMQAARSVSDQGDREDAYARIAEARVRARDFAAARTLLRHIRDPELRGEATENCALVSSYMDRFAEALEFARSLQDDGRKAQTLGRVAREQARAGDFAAALRIAQEVAPVDARVLTYAFISEIATRAGETNVAASTMAETMATMARIPDQGLKDTMATIVAAARARAGDYVGAGETIRTISNVEARIGALAELATIALAANARNAANDVADSLAGIEREGQNEADRVRLLIEASQLKARVGDTGAADTLIREAIEAVPRVEGEAERHDAEARVAAALVRGDATAALAYARAITDRTGRDQAIAGIANALALIGRAADALALVPEINEQPFRDDARRRAALALAASNVQQAIEAAQPAAPPLRNAIYVAIVESRSSAGDATGTLAAAAKVEDVQIRDAALATAARTLARQHRNADGARRVAERIGVRELRDDVMVDVIETEARAGNLAGALASARGLRAPSQRAIALAVVAARLGRPAQ